MRGRGTVLFLILLILIMVQLWWLLARANLFLVQYLKDNIHLFLPVQMPHMPMHLIHMLQDMVMSLKEIFLVLTVTQNATSGKNVTNWMGFHQGIQNKGKGPISPQYPTIYKKGNIPNYKSRYNASSNSLQHNSASNRAMQVTNLINNWIFCQYFSNWIFFYSPIQENNWLLNTCLGA